MCTKTSNSESSTTRTYYTHTTFWKGCLWLQWWKYLSNQERLREQQLFSQTWESSGRSEEERNRLFSVVPSDRTRGNGQKLKYRNSHLNVRGRFCAVRVVKNWNRLLRELVEPLSLQIFRTWLDMSSHIWLTLLKVGLDWTGWAPEVLWGEWKCFSLSHTAAPFVDTGEGSP